MVQHAPNQQPAKPPALPIRIAENAEKIAMAERAARLALRPAHRKKRNRTN